MRVKDRDPSVKIIDNLLTVIVLKEMTDRNCHIERAQESLQVNPWIMDGLKYLKQAMDKGMPVTMAHAEWIERIYS